MKGGYAMPRKPGVYRNVKMLELNCLVLDIKAEETRDEIFMIPYIQDKEKALRYCENTYGTKNLKIIRIKTMVEYIVSYYISIDKFIKYAEVIEEKKGKKKNGST